MTAPDTGHNEDADVEISEKIEENGCIEQLGYDRFIRLCILFTSEPCCTASANLRPPPICSTRWIFSTAKPPPPHWTAAATAHGATTTNSTGKTTPPQPSEGSPSPSYSPTCCAASKKKGSPTATTSCSSTCCGTSPPPCATAFGIT